ncbi:cation-transporting ATPase [Blumeria hordei DH14]|uniref:Cation-transporting ATPase n=1 Tax=Blumeria graminis f. sp. hordei (strain DH14) TaxID=546991 RepID=N1JA48_BLUG1|nr:cation-transporting ATPase [Blumeria hordei DH14]
MNSDYEEQMNGPRRHQNNYEHGPSGGQPDALIRRNSTQSCVSFADTVQMAQDEVFAGPMGESVPTSLSSFAHFRSRADSTTSFTFHQDDEDNQQPYNSPTIDDDSESDSREILIDLEAGTLSPPGPRFSDPSQLSEYDELLGNNHKKTSINHVYRDNRFSQKLHLPSDDLTIVIAGFDTSTARYILYLIICLISCGIGYLILRWLPRWKVRLIGKSCQLQCCDWVAIENQRGDFITQRIDNKKYGHPLSTVFGISPLMHSFHDEEEDPIMENLRVLEYRCLRFSFHPLKDEFILNNSWKDPAWTDVKSVRAGIAGDKKETRESVFGKNLIDIKNKPLMQLLIDEVFHPFYIFQVASLILWSLDQYFYYAACIFLISVISIVTAVFETRSSMKRLSEITKLECDVRVLRNSFWRYVEASDLVPGDIFEVTDPALKQFPCDSILLSGDCVVNESMLTGESVPVSKIPARDETLRALNLNAPSISPEVARHFLYGGTKIVRARRPQDHREDEAVALAMTVRIGFNTTKGALIRSILFPKPSGFKFYRDSFRYISVMAGIALLGFIVSFINFVRLKLAWHLIIVRALDLITIVVPPALPATLTIGTNFALSRLRRKKIFCISPQRVNVGGKLDLICFDKTGTLTEDGLDVLGIRVVLPCKDRFSDLYSSARSLLPVPYCEGVTDTEYFSQNAVLHTMATCHSLRVIGPEIIGDPLDVKMFEFIGWSLEEGQEGGDDIDGEEQSSLSPSIVRPPVMACGLNNDEQFSSVRSIKLLGLHRTYKLQKSPVELGILKSFEFLPRLRRASVIVRNLGSLGCDVYVKGAPECMRDICKPESFPPDYEKLLAYYTHRGYRVIACATKHIAKLNWVKIQKMCRDQAESDLSFVGFIIFENKLKPTTCEVINELTEAGVRKVMCTGDNILTAISVARECNLIKRTEHCFVPRFRNHIVIIKLTIVQPMSHTASTNPSQPDKSTFRSYSLAISGDVFRWLVDFAPVDVLNKVSFLRKYFSRLLQGIGYCCGFCGDGANDCGALKAADVGISLSEAEASVAAPITSQVFDITCVPEVIREGRAALVTSFSCFKYMSLYSAIQFTSVTFLYASGSNLGDFQTNMIQVGWTAAYPVLSRKRPTANLVSRKVLVPLVGQMIISILYQSIGFFTVRKQNCLTFDTHIPRFIPPVLDKNKSNITHSENTVLFLLSCFLYIFSSVILSVGPPFRQSVALNYFQIFILCLGASYLIVAWLSESYLLPWLARLIGKVVNRRSPKQRKIYKVVSSSI